MRSHANMNMLLTNFTSINLNSVMPPRQPVPDLEKTMERYLKFARLLLSETEYRETERIVKEFEKGIGAALQRKLIQRYASMDNWMHGLILNSVYLGRRDPMILKSNQGCVAPIQKFTCPKGMFIFAGKVISAVCEYDRMIKSGEVRQEMAGKVPLDMHQYPIVLGTHRRPEIPVDWLLHTDHSKHIIVLHNNHIFKLNVFEDSGTPFRAGQLAASLEDLAMRSPTVGTPVGILTGSHRDDWAANHAKLRSYGKNDKLLEDIENAMFALCLDKPIPKDLFKDKKEESVRGVQSLTGISIETNAGNRWYDKSLQYFVSYDGFVGLNYEHSLCEAIPVAVLHDHVLKYVAETKSEEYNRFGKFPEAQHLKFEIPPGIEDAISVAAHTVDQITRNLDLELSTFENFGTDEIKRNKMSPDSFIQMGIHLAYYRLHGKLPVHTEATGLRRFLNSRTEYTCCACIESVQFAHAMLGDRSKHEKREAMMKAIKAHKQAINEAATGQGFMRHLSCLRTLASIEGFEMPEIFSDIAYAKSSTFDISTSQVPNKTASCGCFGPRFADNYGICYNPRPKDILLATSSYNSSKETNTKSFSLALKKSFCEMMELVHE